MAFDFLDAHFFDQPVVHDNYTSSEALEANATVTKKRKSRQSQPRDTVRSLNHDGKYQTMYGDSWRLESDWL